MGQQITTHLPHVMPRNKVEVIAMVIKHVRPTTTANHIVQETSDIDLYQLLGIGLSTSGGTSEGFWTAGFFNANVTADTLWAFITFSEIPTSENTINTKKYSNTLGSIDNRGPQLPQT